MTGRLAKIALGICFVILTCASFATRLTPKPARVPLASVREDFNSRLTSINSLEAAVPVVDRYIARERGSRQERIAAGIDHFIRDRFVHGYSRFYIQENWTARAAGFAWANLAMPVTPDTILEHRHALCSQQSIVFMALLRHYGIDFGSVLMSWPDPDPASRGHFAVAARVDEVWRYYDANQEARVSGAALASVIDGSALARLYPHRSNLVIRMRHAIAAGDIRLAHVNVNPAPRGTMFEEATQWFSRWGWLATGVLWVACFVLI